MEYLLKSHQLTSLSLEEIKSSTANHSKQLLEAISKAVDMNLASSCKVISISHNVELKARIINTTSIVKLEELEKPGNTLVYKDEPKDLQMFSYEKLKQDSILKSGVYRGKLYGTIESYSCDEKVNCPDCDGSGICCCCEGEKQVTCPICDGNISCVSCNGTGKYTCENCDGDGECPECDDGWVSCQDCYGEGEVNCPDCNGSGIYYEDTCNKCGGSGEYYNHRYGTYVTCRGCGGSGTFFNRMSPM